IQKVQLHNVLRCFSNHSFCLLLLFINQTQGNVTTLPRPMESVFSSHNNLLKCCFLRGWRKPKMSPGC
uniref:Uncharacterized protein n=1 Tax=Phocoena sinus TaxID=42100 RepID=A0A8C9EDF6_PHOSS